MRITKARTITVAAMGAAAAAVALAPIASATQNCTETGTATVCSNSSIDASPTVLAPQSVYGSWDSPWPIIAFNHWR